jgi:hypothetical protein
MKKQFLLACIIGLLVLTACGPNKWEEKGFANYNEFVIADFNNLVPPVILMGAAKDQWSHYSITIIDGRDTIRSYDNMSTFANTIGASRKVGDTLKKSSNYRN